MLLKRFDIFVPACQVEVSLEVVEKGVMGETDLELAISVGEGRGL